MRWRNTAYLACVALAACVILVAGLWRTRAATQGLVSRDPAHTPSSGWTVNDTGGMVPGDPRNAISDLEGLYSALQIYRRIHGVSPGGLVDLHGDLRSDSGAYAAALKGCTPDDLFFNPDQRYADDPVLRNNPEHAIAYEARDLSRSSRGDVVAFTSIYSHGNVREYPHERSTANPVGLYVVLWGNGVVTEVPYDQVLFIPRGDGDYVKGFPGQSGLPPGTLTYDQFYRKVGARRGPRGGVGRPGVPVVPGR